MTDDKCDWEPTTELRVNDDNTRFPFIEQKWRAFEWHVTHYPVPTSSKMYLGDKSEWRPLPKKSDK